MILSFCFKIQQKLQNYRKIRLESKDPIFRTQLSLSHLSHLLSHHKKLFNFIGPQFSYKYNEGIKINYL